MLLPFRFILYLLSFTKYVCVSVLHERKKKKSLNIKIILKWKTTHIIFVGYLLIKKTTTYRCSLSFNTYLKKSKEYFQFEAKQYTYDYTFNCNIYLHNPIFFFFCTLIKWHIRIFISCLPSLSFSMRKTIEFIAIQRSSVVCGTLEMYKD